MVSECSEYGSESDDTKFGEFGAIMVRTERMDKEISGRGSAADQLRHPVI